jgi:nucleoside transporter
LNEPRPPAGAVHWRLSAMMFLQYAVWGAWLPLAGRYMSATPSEGGLGFSGPQIGVLLGAAGSIGAVFAPFLAGQIADRYFRTERCLCGLLAFGGAIQWVMAAQTSYRAWLWLSVVYSIVYMPTLALSNSLAFAHLSDRGRQFPLVRVWGTIGWIAASWSFPMLFLQTGLRLSAMPPFLVGDELPGVTARLADSLRFSGGLSLAYAAYCLSLPATPPKRDAVEPLAFARAFALLRKRPFAVLVAASLPISVVHQIYFIQAPPFFSALGLKDSQIGPAMTLGQFSEIAAIALLGRALGSLGMRTVLFLGAAAYVARYGIWSMTDLPVPVLVASQVLHGVCYAFFFAAAYILVERIAPEDVRNSAQTVFGILILGLGPVIGGQLSGWLQERYSSGDDVDYGSLWLVLCAIAFVTAIGFWVAFRDAEASPRAPEPPS